MTIKTDMLQERLIQAKIGLAQVQEELAKLRKALLAGAGEDVAGKIVLLQVREMAFLEQVKRAEADLEAAKRLSSSPEAIKAVKEIKRLEAEAEQAGRKISKAIVTALKDAEAAIEKVGQADRLKITNGLDAPLTETLRLVNFMAAELHNIDKAGSFAFKEFWG